MPLHTRPATEDDLPALARLDKEVFADLAYPYFILRQFFDLCEDHALVLDDGHTLHGYVLATSPCADVSWILSLGITGNLQGKGLGRQLMIAILGRLRSEKAHEVRLTVDPDNDRAVSLYQRLGFTQAGDVRKDYFGPGEHRVLMTLDLADSAAPAHETPPSAPSATPNSGPPAGP